MKSFIGFNYLQYLQILFTDNRTVCSKLRYTTMYTKNNLNGQ